MLITQEKNDILFYQRRETDRYGYSVGYSTLHFAGGRVVVPVYLMWLTWAVILFILFVVEGVEGFISGALADYPTWTWTGVYMLVTLGWFVIYWPIYCAVEFIQMWVRVFRGEYRPVDTSSRDW